MPVFTYVALLKQTGTPTAPRDNTHSYTSAPTFTNAFGKWTLVTMNQKTIHTSDRRVIHCHCHVGEFCQRLAPFFRLRAGPFIQSSELPTQYYPDFGTKWRYHRVISVYFSAIRGSSNVLLTLATRNRAVRDISYRYLLPAFRPPT